MPTTQDRLEAYAFLVARSAAELAGEDSKYPPPPARPCKTTSCTTHAEPGCGNYCLHCWHERRALSRLY